MKIVCDHCKHEIESCPDCNSSKIEQKYGINLIFLVIALTTCLVFAYRWHSSLDEYERAQNLRKKYLKQKLRNQPTLPFNK
jgi:hypothetical protein